MKRVQPSASVTGIMHSLRQRDGRLCANLGRVCLLPSGRFTRTNTVKSSRRLRRLCRTPRLGIGAMFPFIC